ncbi:MAG: hypothetical protein AAFX99_11285, partial [Myxococcota bacterium]
LEETACPEGQSCSDIGGDAFCATPCDSCAPGERRCSGNGLEVCAWIDEVLGCAGWLPISCGPQGTCVESDEGAECVCEDSCTPGETRCSGEQFEVCASEPGGCFGFVLQEDCGQTPACVSARCDERRGCELDFDDDVCDDGIDCTDDNCTVLGCQNIPYDEVCDGSSDNACVRTVCDPEAGGCTERVLEEGSPCGQDDSCSSMACTGTPPSAERCETLGWETFEGRDGQMLCASDPHIGAGEEGNCPEPIPFAEAEAMCTAAGARLCTITEVDEALEQTQCGSQFWSQSPCGEGQVMTLGNNGRECVPLQDSVGDPVCCADAEAIAPPPLCLPTEGMGCDDNNACTTGDYCDVNGQCEANDRLRCNDNIGCTADSCDPTSGCQHTPDDTACSDHACIAGVCDPEAGGCILSSRQGEVCGDAEECGSLTCVGVEPSSSTCNALGWPQGQGSNTVCAASNVLEGSNEESCSGPTTYMEAEAICEGLGARLCTLEEVENDETRGTGCGYDDSRIWTQSSCGTSQVWTASGSTAFADSYPTTCKPMSGTGEEFSVRCCADAQNRPLEPVSCMATGLEEGICSAGLDNPCTYGLCAPDGSGCQEFPVFDGLSCNVDPMSIELGICLAGVCDICVDDPFDPGDDNQDGAVVLPNNQLEQRTLCSQDEDWFFVINEEPNTEVGLITHNGRGNCRDIPGFDVQSDNAGQVSSTDNPDRRCPIISPASDPLLGPYSWVQVQGTPLVQLDNYGIKAIVFSEHSPEGTPDAASAVPITGSSSYTTSQLFQGEVDWYQFTTDGQTAWTFDTDFFTCPTDTVLEIYNSEGNLLHSNDGTPMSGCARLSGRPLHPMPAGTYTLAVKAAQGHVGRYTLLAEARPATAYQTDDALVGSSRFTLPYDETVLIEGSDASDGPPDYYRLGISGEGRTPVRVEVAGEEMGCPFASDEIRVSMRRNTGAHLVLFDTQGSADPNGPCVAGVWDMEPGQEYILDVYIQTPDERPYTLMLRTGPHPW